MAKDKLSPAQERILELMRLGSPAIQKRYCGAIYINGKRVCNLDTMTVLERKGFVEKLQCNYWQVTEKGMVSDGKP